MGRDTAISWMIVNIYFGYFSNHFIGIPQCSYCAKFFYIWLLSNRKRYLSLNRGLSILATIANPVRG
jgi:hypothetical protein